MKEIPGFFANREGRRLFSILHGLETDSEPPLALVYCAPILEERLWSHRVAVDFARYMAGLGVPVLRFDYFGCGESEGEFIESSLRSRVRDIVDAVAHCREMTRTRNVALVGLGVGASLALAAAAGDTSLLAVAAWSPLANGEKYVSELLRSHLAAQMVIHRRVVQDREELVREILSGVVLNVDGYEIGRVLYQELLDLRLAPLLAAARCRRLVVQVSPTVKTEEQFRDVESTADAHTQFLKVSELKFWTQQKRVFPPCTDLFEVTARWMRSQ